MSFYTLFESEFKQGLHLVVLLCFLRHNILNIYTPLSPVFSHHWFVEDWFSMFWIFLIEFCNLRHGCASRVHEASEIRWKRIVLSTSPTPNPLREKACSFHEILEEVLDTNMLNHHLRRAQGTLAQTLPVDEWPSASTFPLLGSRFLIFEGMVMLQTFPGYKKGFPGPHPSPRICALGNVRDFPYCT